MKNAKKAFKKMEARLRKKEWAALRYGEDNEGRKQKMLEGNAEKMRGNMTQPERLIEMALKKMEIQHESQKILGDFIYDFHLPEYRILIEVDGDYYHGHPDKYDKEDLNGLQKKIKRNDLLKDQLARGMNYVLLRFWECDINQNMAMVKKIIQEQIDGSKI